MSLTRASRLKVRILPLPEITKMKIRIVVPKKSVAAGTPKKFVLVAIDPGKSGGIVWNLGDKLKAIPMPGTIQELAAHIDTIKPDEVWIEKVHTSPQMGVVSAGSFMKGVGQIEGVCAAYFLPIREVTPQKWMKFFELGKAKQRMTKKGKTVKDIGEWKRRLLILASKLFPRLTPTLQTADAILIWEYARQNRR